MTLARYEFLLSQGGFYPLADRCFWSLSGPDRLRYLNGQITQEARKAADGGSHYTCVCTAKGRLEGDLYFRDWPGRAACLLDFAVDLRKTLPGRLEKYLISDDAIFADVTAEITAFHVFGPLAELWKSANPAGVWLSAANRLGLEGLDVFAESPSRLPLAEGAEDHQLSPKEAAQLRILNGIPAWGAELGPETLPPEAGLEDRAIDYHKGCYVGQEVISRLRSVGQVNRQLRRLIAEDGIPSAGQGVFALSGEQPVEIGKITSVAMHPMLDRAVALAYLNRRQIGPGLRLTSASPESTHLCRFEPLAS